MIPTGQPEFFVTKSRVNEQRDCWKQGPRPTRRARLEQLLFLVRREGDTTVGADG